MFKIQSFRLFSDLYELWLAFRQLWTPAQRDSAYATPALYRLLVNATEELRKQWPILGLIRHMNSKMTRAEEFGDSSYRLLV